MRGLAWLSAAVALCGCPPGPSPHPAPPTGPSPEAVWGELADAGCVDPKDEGGPAALAAENASPSAPSWVTCLFDGGTVARCGVPCSEGGSP